MTHEELVKEAFKAMDNAYAPYSNYHVGACVLCKDGTTFYGANIENASFGGTNCGERSAIFAAYSRGYRKKDIEAINDSMPTYKRINRVTVTDEPMEKTTTGKVKRYNQKL